MSSTPVFEDTVQVTPLDCLLLVAGDLYVPIRDTTLDRLLPPRYYTDRLKDIPRLFVKEAYFLVLELWPDGQASGLAHT